MEKYGGSKKRKYHGVELEPKTIIKHEEYEITGNIIMLISKFNKRDHEGLNLHTAINAEIYQIKIMINYT